METNSAVALRTLAVTMPLERVKSVPSSVMTTGGSLSAAHAMRGRPAKARNVESARAADFEKVMEVSSG
jgi:hypothetical protein